VTPIIPVSKYKVKKSECKLLLTPIVLPYCNNKSSTDPKPKLLAAILSLTKITLEYLDNVNSSKFIENVFNKKEDTASEYI